MSQNGVDEIFNNLVPDSLHLVQGYTGNLRISALLFLAAVLLIGCNSDGSGVSGHVIPEASTDWQRDILLTTLDIDLESMTGRADLVLAGSSSSTGASFEIGDLTILNVTSNGTQLNYNIELDRLDVGVPMSVETQTLTIEYRLNVHENFNGVLESGVTFTWPYFCGNIFPCRSAPGEGSHYQLLISGIPDGAIGIYPQSVTSDVPAYMLAWAVGEYDYRQLGETANGTEVGVYFLADQEHNALLGTQNLAEVFDWYEQTYGEYGFGNRVASVAVDWIVDNYGGMEHHPFWHIADGSLSDPVMHAHEAAHGWFGNGVRIACWEDFVLSEGLASYLAARALSEVVGEAFANQVWLSYENRLNQLQNSNENKIAWPQGCNDIDILSEGFFGAAPYMKGAFFFKHLENVLGKELLDGLLGEFYAENRGKAVTLQELLSRIKEASSYDPHDCAEAWLRMASLPQSGRCPY
jgi:aminopeptidase N